MSGVDDLFEVAEYWRAVVLAALDVSGADPVTTTYTGVGLVAWDDCCGQLVMTPERVYRSVQFPLEAVEPERCWTGHEAVELLCTLVRCVPVPDDRGRAPSPAALSAAHAKVLADAQTVWCAMSSEIPADREWERSTLRQTFVGGLGGCISVETRMTVGVEGCC